MCMYKRLEAFSSEHSLSLDTQDKGRFTTFPDLNIQIEGKCLTESSFLLSNTCVCVSRKKVTHGSPPGWQYLSVPHSRKESGLVVKLDFAHTPFLKLILT